MRTKEKTNQSNPKVVAIREGLKSLNFCVLSDENKKRHESLSKYDASHGVDLHHLFKLLNNKLNDITDVCENHLVVDEFIEINSHIGVIWTLLRLIKDHVPQSLFDDLEMLNWELAKTCKTT